MSASNVYVNSVLSEVITYVELWRDNTVVYDESPWSSNETIVTPECAKNGNGQCDGYSENGAECECACHTINWGNATVEDIERFHVQMWAGQPEDYEYAYEKFSGNA